MKKYIYITITLLFAGTVFAQDIAYVAKQDGKTIYIDTTELGSKLKQGSSLKLVESSEELKNHKGVSLGTIHKYGPTVTVTSVQDMYAVGSIAVEYQTKPGQKMEVDAAAVPAQTPVIVTKAALKEEAPMQDVEMLYKSQPIADKVLSSTMIKLGGKDYIVMALESGNKVKIITMDGKDYLEHAVSPYKKILTISAGDIKGTGTPQIYAVVFEESSAKTTTLVLEIADGKISQTGSFKWMAKVAAMPGGTVLLGQEIYRHNEIKTTPVGTLEYNAKKNNFKYTKMPVKSSTQATFSAYNVDDFDGDGKEDSIFATEYGRIKILTAKGKKIDLNDGAYSTTPVRFNMGSTIVRVLLPITYVGSADKHVFAVAENLPKVAVVADSFGIYKSGVIRFVGWNGVTLKTFAELESDGVIYDLAAVSYGGARGVLVTQVYDSGNSILEIYKLK
ncbi:hypothetical protein AAIR98_000353 [Elusimicrobium simillimum]|uniref:hypothetical protein n=1 Tax=Elusimicrobium simillimum TaxID=3143438 RepID=UPI003C700587